MKSETLNPTREHYDDGACRCLDMSVGQAAVTRSEKVGSAHILLAVLQSEEPLFDALLREAMQGLRAVTLADAVREELTIESDLNDQEAGNFPDNGLPRADDLAEDAIALLARADEYKETWKCARVPAAALACAAFASPDPIALRVFRGIGLKPEQCAAVVARLSAQESAKPFAATAELVVFRESRLNTASFEPLVREAFSRIAPVLAERMLVEADLLAALLEDKASRIAELLAVMSVNVSDALKTLRGLAPKPDAGAAGEPPKDIPEDHVSRLMKRVLNEARTLAEADRAPLISEAHLIVSHIDRVAGVGGNLYECLKIDSEKLRRGLAGEDDLFADGLLRLAVFGPVARAAWESLVPAAAARRLLDSDLLLALLNQSDSRLVETLQVMGAPVPTIRAALAQMAGKTPARGAGTSKVELGEKHLGTLLQRILRESMELARRENAELVSESHLLRAHIDRVAGSSGNLYERLGVDVRRLYEALARNRADRLPGSTQKQKADRGQITDIAGYLNAHVINQPHAVAAATKALVRMRSGLNEPGQVMGKFLFLGPTGVGKTELARAMATVAFGEKPGARDAHIIRIDCGNFQNRWDVVQLIGAAQGLVGYKEGQLTNGLKEKPRSIILFDEAEKADKAIWQSLLPLFDEGIVREADGTQYDATGCILLATSNKGYAEAIQALNVWERNWDDVRDQVQGMVWDAMGSYFSPEFLGRFGRENVIYFNHFSKANYRDLLELQIGNLVVEMESRGLEVSFSNKDAAVGLLSELAWIDRREGARPVRRLVTSKIRDLIIGARGVAPDRTRFQFDCLPGSGEILLGRI